MREEEMMVYVDDMVYQRVNNDSRFEALRIALELATNETIRICVELFNDCFFAIFKDNNDMEVQRIVTDILEQENFTFVDYEIDTNTILYFNL
jgi:hypothetical protein